MPIEIKHAWLGRLMQVGAAVALLCMSEPGPAQQSVNPADTPVPDQIAGEYVHSQMELVAGILLKPDGAFLYALTVGSLDERAQGRWKAHGNRIEFTSDPRPVAPTITLERVEASPGRPFAIRVVARNGRDVPGVDLLVEFETGEPLQSYTTGEAWTLPVEEQRKPRFVTFSMPSYRLQSERLRLEPKTATTAIFTFTPNDFGVVDLTGVEGEMQGDTLIINRREGVMKFRRAVK